MVRATSDLIRLMTSGRRFKLSKSPNAYNVDLHKSLALAHALLKSQKFALAERICEAAIQNNVSAPQAAILLACCKAGVQEFAACNQILQNVFANDARDLADHLQAALVCFTLGMLPEALAELVTVADEIPDLAVIWLLLGDTYAVMGDNEAAVYCWRMAVERDAAGGPIALAAQRQLTPLREKPASY